MPAVVYPYTILAGRRSPLIPLGLGYQDKWQRLQAYVDSGAFYSVFKTDFALLVGLVWQQGERVYVQVGDGGFMPIYLHTVDAQLQRYCSLAALGSLTLSGCVLTSSGVPFVRKICHLF